MKYLSLVLALCLSLIISASANEANPEENVQLYVTPISEKILDLALTNLQQQRTTIAVTNVDGSVTYFRDVVKKHNGYRKRLNFNELQDGKYLLVVTQGTEKFQQVIVLKKDRGMLLSAIK